LGVWVDNLRQSQSIFTIDITPDTVKTLYYDWQCAGWFLSSAFIREFYPFKKNHHEIIYVIANGSNVFVICTVYTIGYTIFMREKPRAPGVSPIAAAVESWSLR
jgi:hypothetical protein